MHVVPVGVRRGVVQAPACVARGPALPDASALQSVRRQDRVPAPVLHRRPGNLDAPPRGGSGRVEPARPRRGEGQPFLLARRRHDPGVDAPSARRGRRGASPRLARVAPAASVPASGPALARRHEAVAGAGVLSSRPDRRPGETYDRGARRATGRRPPHVPAGRPLAGDRHLPRSRPETGVDPVRHGFGTAYRRRLASGRRLGRRRGREVRSPPPLGSFGPARMRRHHPGGHPPVPIVDAGSVLDAG